MTPTRRTLEDTREVNMIIITTRDSNLKTGSYFDVLSGMSNSLGW